MEAGEHAVGRGLPGDSEQDGLTIEGFLSAGGPDAFVDEVTHSETLATAPDSSGAVEGHRFLASLAVFAFLRFAAGDDHALIVLQFQLLQFPNFPLAKAVAGLVFQEEHVVLGGEDSCASIVVRINFLTLHWQNGHGRIFRVRWEKGVDVQYGSEGNIPEIRRCAVITNDAVGQHGEGVRIISEKLSIPLHTDAASAVGMIHEDKLATIGVRPFQRREFSCLGSKRFATDFTFGVGGAREGNAEVERGDPADRFELSHGSMSVLREDGRSRESVLGAVLE